MALMGGVAQSVCVLSFFALGLASSQPVEPWSISESSRLGESAVLTSNSQMTITAPKELLKDVPAIMCAGWRAGAHKNNPALKQLCLGVSAAENQSQKAPTCHTSCTETCAKEHAQGKKHPICDLPYSATSYDKTPQQHPDGEVKIVKLNGKKITTRDKLKLARCKNQIKMKWGQRNFLTCTSCKSGNALVPFYANSRTGHCSPMVEHESVKCTNLGTGIAGPPGPERNPMEKNVMCTK